MADTKPFKSAASSSGFLRSMTDIRPTHYFLKINSFSYLLEMLQKENAKSYDSNIFEVGGYKWNLSLYPNGNEERNGAGHISLYLNIQATSNLPLGWEVIATFKFFVLDHIQDKYLTIQADHRRFNEIKKTWGFPQVLPLAEFKDPTNGYLFHDECVFGVEVSVCQYSGRGECVGRPEKQISNSSTIYTWKVTSYSTLPKSGVYKSSEFTLENHKWSIDLYPRGFVTEEGKSISVFLRLHNDCSTDKVYAEFELRIKDQRLAHHCEQKGGHLFTSDSKDWGYGAFLPLSDIEDESKGFLVNDSLVIEVEMTKVLAIKDF